MPIPTSPPSTPTSSTWAPYAGDWTGSINGLNFGPGTAYRLAGLTGWRQIIAGPTGASGQLLPPRMSRHGSFKQPYFVPFRIVNLQLSIVGSSVAQFESAIEALEAATVPNDTALVSMSMQINGISSSINGFVETRDILTDYESQFGLAHATIGLKAPDPRRLGAAVTGTALLPSPSGGASFPLAFPAAFTGGVPGGASLTNAGDATGPLVAQVNGPLSGAFSLTQASTGLTLSFGSSTAIAAGDYLLVDMENRAVLYNGQAQASRNGWITQRGWFGFAPGANTFQFNASTYSSSASALITGTPAWL